MSSNNLLIIGHTGLNYGVQTEDEV